MHAFSSPPHQDATVIASIIETTDQPQSGRRPESEAESDSDSEESEDPPPSQRPRLSSTTVGYHEHAAHTIHLFLMQVGWLGGFILSDVSTLSLNTKVVTADLQNDVGKTLFQCLLSYALGARHDRRTLQLVPKSGHEV